MQRRQAEPSRGSTGGRTLTFDHRIVLFSLVAGTAFGLTNIVWMITRPAIPEPMPEPNYVLRSTRSAINEDPPACNRNGNVQHCWFSDTMPDEVTKTRALRRAYEFNNCSMTRYDDYSIDLTKEMRKPLTTDPAIPC